MALVEITWHPDRHRLRQFGAAAAAVLTALGALALWRERLLEVDLGPSAAEKVAVALWLLAATCAVLAAAVPMVLRPAYVGLSLVAAPVGVVVSCVVLAVIYFGVMMPIGLVLRLTGRDPLGRRFDPQAASYWVRRKGTTDVRRYFRQF